MIRENAFRGCTNLQYVSCQGGQASFRRINIERGNDYLTSAWIQPSE